MNRNDQLAENLSKINYQIEAACQKANRSINEITVIAVTKFFPASDVEILAKLGIKDVGENKDQEAKEKFQQIKSNLNWHFVGQLQTNKVKSVLQYADFIHSVDRLRLAKEINKVAINLNRPIKIFLQVDLGGDDPNRGGVDPAGLLELANEIAAGQNLELAGLMAVAPLGEDARDAFARLLETRREFLKEFPSATLLSCGMSEDFEIAIEFGATHLRIGSLLLGVRPTLL
jgi:pyridoxal phosphate enzyme (YggS family)